MKRTITLICAAAASVIFAATAGAQFNAGIIGGATFTSGKPSEWKATNVAQGHIGATLKIALPLGFAVQPSLVYQMKGTAVPEGEYSSRSYDYRCGYLEIPVSIQWGPDLLIMRPYLECVPYFGYALNNKFKGEGNDTVKNDWDGLNRWEYGVGLGVGLEVWHFQISARYNWGLGSMFTTGLENLDGLVGGLRAEIGDRNSISGVSLSLAVMF